MTIFYLDPVNGNDAADGSTFALGGLPSVGPWKTITGGPTAARIAPGDVIRIAKSPDPTSLGQTAAWTSLSRDVVLQTGAVTQEVDNCESAAANWTRVDTSNLTLSDSTAWFKLGSNSLKLVVGASFAGGKAIYQAFGSAQNFSGKQQLSLYFRNSAALTAGHLVLKLCSDAAGDTPVTNGTFAFPGIPSNSGVPITIDLAADIGSGINSVGIYLDTAYAGELYFDNIIVCKAASAADSLTLQSLISKNSAAQGGLEPWYCLQSINGTTLKIDNHTNQLGNGGRGYTGDTETVTIYKRETTKTALVASGDVQAVQDSGTATAYIEFQGGYDTSSGLQDGETFFDGLNGLGNGLRYDKSFILLNYLWAYRYNNGFPSNFGNFPGVQIYNGGACHCTTENMIGAEGPAIDLQNIKANNGGGRGLRGFGEIAAKTGYIHANGNMDRGIYNCYRGELNIVVAKNNAVSAIGQISGYLSIKELTTADNGNCIVQFANGARLRAAKSSIGEASPVTFVNRSVLAQASFGKWGGVTTDHRTYKDMGTIFSETSVRHTASGLAWKLTPSANASIIVPLILPVAQVAVNASAEVTVKAWLRRSNTGLTLALVCRGGQIAGVDDVVASVNADADIWQEVTLYFTPTEAGVVEIEVWAYGGTAYSGYVDDMSFDQAA